MFGSKLWHCMLVKHWHCMLPSNGTVCYQAIALYEMRVQWFVLPPPAYSNKVCFQRPIYLVIVYLSTTICLDLNHTCYVNRVPLYQSSVTRYYNFTTLEKFEESSTIFWGRIYLKLCRIFKPTLAILCAIGPKLHLGKWPNIEKMIAPSCHTV